MPRTTHLWTLVLLGVSCLGFAGCDSSTKPTTGANAAKDEHEHGHKEGKHGHEAGHEKEEHPETYAEAVKEIDELRTAVKDFMAKNDLKQADKPLHELGHVLEEVVGLAKKTSLDAAAQEEIKKAVSDLLDSFAKVDDKIHGGTGATYEEVSTKVDAAMTTLRQHVPGSK